MRTAFIIGNGPSLAKTDLELLIGSDSFACNNIHLIYPKTKWRPTYYVRSESADLLLQDAWKESVAVHLDMGIPCYMSGYFREASSGYANYHEIKHCVHHTMNYDHQDVPSEWHMPWLCQFGGSLIVSMQIALNMGYERLVLLGCDLGYRDNKQSHFDPAYEHGSEQKAIYANRNQIWAHLCGIHYYKRRGLPYNVINCTIGGDLHLYHRARLEDIL